jgi:hypothetical protein
MLCSATHADADDDNNKECNAGADLTICKIETDTHEFIQQKRRVNCASQLGDLIPGSRLLG